MKQKLQKGKLYEKKEIIEIDNNQLLSWIQILYIYILFCILGIISYFLTQEPVFLLLLGIAIGALGHEIFVIYHDGRKDGYFGWYNSKSFTIKEIKNKK